MSVISVSGRVLLAKLRIVSFGDERLEGQEHHVQAQGGENPDMAELNIYVTGRGTVWIDDIKPLTCLLEQAFSAKPPEYQPLPACIPL
jgi:hypothetical protein